MYKSRITKGWQCILVVAAMLASLVSAVVPATPVAAATTSITVNKYDAHGNLLATQTVTWEWMRDNLPVQGDGITHYYCEGPNFSDPPQSRTFETLWDVTEGPGDPVPGNINSRDYGAAKGTDIKDLCNLVGGASPGSIIKATAIDGWSREFDYENIYTPDPRQGPIVATWYTTGAAEGHSGYIPDYDTGMRLLFFTPIVDSIGRHVFGDYDEYLTWPENRWYFYYSDGWLWPTTSGPSGKYISRIDLFPPKMVSCDAAGNEKDTFLTGETVYVKGQGLTASQSYKLWIQPEPAVWYTSAHGDQVPGATVPAPLNAANDPSGAQESVTTDASGDFSPVAIWTTDPSAPHLKYDIVADNQAAGTIGRFDISDGCDNPGFQGFKVSGPVTLPVAAFTSDVQTVAAYSPVNFTDQSTGTLPRTYAWDFNNDGTVDSTNRNPSYAYTTPGTYSVKLVVTNEGGSDDEIKTNYITVTPPAPPVANFTADVVSGAAPLTVKFTDQSASGVPLTGWAWDFDNDGTVDSTAQSPTFIYYTPGTYTVRLTATNSGGSDEEVKTDFISVSSVPVYTLNLPLNGDTYINQMLPTSNYGSSTSMYVYKATTAGRSRRSLVSVDLSPMPSGLTITSAKLYLYLASATQPSTQAIHRVTSPWSESAVTWTNQPSYDPTATVTLSTGTASGWREWDVTADVQTFAAGTNNNGWLIKLVDENPTASISLYYRSKEYSNPTQRPYLQITFSTPLPPIAAFTADKTAGVTPLTVRFTNQSVRTPTAWAWDFDNNGTVDSTNPNPTYTYATPGIYTVKLTVTNEGGSDEEVKAAYITVSPTIIASAGANGSISPSGNIVLTYGSDQTFTIIPAAHYHIADVLVDGASVGAVTSYTFTNVTANHTIKASFAIDTFTIAASAGANGSITPSGSVTVNYGASQTFAITPNTGYYVADVLVDVASVGGVTSYTFTNVTDNHTISATFGLLLKTFSISKMTVDFSHQDDRDTIFMNAKAALPDGTSFNPASDNVNINIDGYIVNIPSGSFKALGWNMPRDFYKGFGWDNEKDFFKDFGWDNQNDFFKRFGWNNRDDFGRDSGWDDRHDSSKPFGWGSQIYLYRTGPRTEPSVMVLLNLKKGEANLVVRRSNVDVINNSNGVAVALRIGPATGMQNITMFVESLTYSYKGTDTPASFRINKMVIDYSRQDDRDAIFMDAKLTLPDGTTFNPASDNVSVNIDGYIINIPAGSFKTMGWNILDGLFKDFGKHMSRDSFKDLDNGAKVYFYRTSGRDEPSILATLNFKKGEMNLVVRKANVDIVNNSDGVAVTLKIGSFVVSQNINMFVESLTYSATH